MDGNPQSPFQVSTSNWGGLNMISTKQIQLCTELESKIKSVLHVILAIIIFFFEYFCRCSRFTSVHGTTELNKVYYNL